MKTVWMLLLVVCFAGCDSRYDGSAQQKLYEIKKANAEKADAKTVAEISAGWEPADRQAVDDAIIYRRVCEYYGCLDGWAESHYQKKTRGVPKEYVRIVDGWAESHYQKKTRYVRIVGERNAYPEDRYAKLNRPNVAKRVTDPSVDIVQVGTDKRLTVIKNIGKLADAWRCTVWLTRQKDETFAITAGFVRYVELPFAEETHRWSDTFVVPNEFEVVNITAADRATAWEIRGQVAYITLVTEQDIKNIAPAAESIAFEEPKEMIRCEIPVCVTMRHVGKSSFADIQRRALGRRVHVYVNGANGRRPIPDGTECLIDFNEHSSRFAKRVIASDGTVLMPNDGQPHSLLVGTDMSRMVCVSPTAARIEVDQ